MICLDANIVIEMMLERPKAAACRRLLAKTSDELAITILSINLIMYFAEKKKLPLAPVEQLLKQFVWLATSQVDTRTAFELYDSRDFEDGLQIATSLRHKASVFVTLDKALTQKYRTTMRIQLL